ncbi:uncharacterized protein EDB91DRAFT_1145212 [Suillus paluster]|uniref:uncharacterized protein n=1 Tax=Suillus paluster TaxID=48578 RepID=UPI001B86DA45|nr:uncharacterized protein EDB91DRAFT_1145212 [Suillus paluster]KAG1735098.1 hypothetical protein EDB91DRAFT_1145212 [Suillus paluster]
MFYEVVLYHADNLGPGQHQVTLTNLAAANGLAQELNIDYALLTSLSNSLGSSISSVCVRPLNPSVQIGQPLPVCSICDFHVR